MNKKILSVLILSFLFLGFGIKAYADCTRDPAGSPVYNTDIFNFSCGGLADPENCGVLGLDPCIYAQFEIVGTGNP
jgi:hypothetical protein